MNFYIGNSINEVDVRNNNVEFSDELLDYIYKVSKRVSFDMSRLYEVDPYDDIEIPKKDIPRIIEICKYILDSFLLEDYEKPDEGIEMVRNLVEISKKALKKGMGLISIGD